MQRRERLLAIAVGVLAGAWLLDGAVLGPALAWYDGVRAAATAAEEESARGRALVDRQARIMADWRSRHAAGLLDDEATARFRMQTALAAAARSSGLAIDSVGGGQVIPAARDETCDSLRLTASGQGGLAQAMAFLDALSAVGQPLRVERSEIGSVDARRDQVELSLIVSTRLVATSARAGRGIPDGTPPWPAEAVDPARSAAVVAARPFLADRSAARRPSTAAVTTAAAPAAAGGWALVGIVQHEGQASAFLRHLGDGSERVLTTGEEIDERMLTAVEAGGVVFGEGETAQRIAVGCDLTGAPIPNTVPARRSAPTASTPTSTATPSAPAATDGSREAILERLRQQRNRTP